MDSVIKAKALSWELLTACEKACEAMKPHAETDVFAYLSLGFLQKATRTLKAVNVLYDNDLSEQAQALVRILFELRVTFDCFLAMAKQDTQEACRRVNDSMMLEKIKQMKASAFAGIPDSVRERFENYEKEIEDQYDMQELRKIKAHGFTGLSVEQRAQSTGNEQVYSIVYRNFSRNVHSTDFVENFLLLEGTSRKEYIESRELTSFYVARFSAGGIAVQVNNIFHCGIDSELQAIGRKQELLKKNDS